LASPSPPSWDCSSRSPEDTAAVAAALAAQLRPGDVVELEGELGTGKTTFVQAACRALGVSDPVTSPTYTIGALHSSPAGPVAHLDLYRSNGLTDEEWADLEPYFEGTIAFVEWPGAGRGILPPARVAVHLRHQGGDARLITLVCTDPELLEAVARTLD
jgi:tRNA threonylcarbamoyladenosine biosynthesis protein TsaE